MPRERPRRVAVLVGSSLSWREKVMRGIAGYAHEHGPWHVYTAPEGTEDTLFFSEKYRWDGAIVRVLSDRLSRRLRALGVPAVSIGSVRVHSGDLPRIKVDDAKLSRLAVRHLVAIGLRHFGFCTFFRRRTDEDRGLAFARLLAEQGCECHFYCEFSRLRAGAGWQARQRDLARWLRRLEKPVGVFAWNADLACQLVEACHAAGLNCPQDVAVLSADEDIKCELSSPTVSALEIPAVRMGYEAAVLLDRLMDGGPPPAEPILVSPPEAITIRESTSSAGLKDGDIHRAAEFIRAHAREPITVAQVARDLQVSRRWLERHFQRVLGRSPHGELRRVRLEQAKKLLLETDWAMTKIARATGLTSAPYLNHVFRRETGLTPAQFRQRFRPG